MKLIQYIYSKCRTEKRKEKSILMGGYKCVFNKDIKRGYKSFLWGRYIKRYGDMVVDKDREIRRLEKHLKKYNFDDAYFFGNASGEIFYFLHFFKEVIKKNKSNNPIIISQRKFLPDLVKMFYPNVKVIKYWTDLYWIADSTKPFSGKKGHRYFFPFNEPYFLALEKKHREGKNIHFYKNILSTFSLKTPSQFPLIPDDSIEKADELLKNVKSPFVLIFSEANSNSTLSDYFWMVLKEKIKNLGYDVIFNKNSISLSSIRYIASKASVVIGIRSGAIDIVADVSKKIIVYYLPFSNRLHFSPQSSKTVLENFSLNKIFKKDAIEMDVPALGENTVYQYTIREIMKLKGVTDELS